MVESLDKIALQLILRYVPPIDALALRATSKHMNTLIINCQKYWYFQLQRKVITIHYGQIDGNCFRVDGGVDWGWVYNMLYLSVRDESVRKKMDTQYQRALYTYQHENNSVSLYNRALSDIIDQYGSYFHPVYCRKSSHTVKRPMLFGEETMTIVLPTENTGYYMYHFLMDCYKRLKTKVKRTKSGQVNRVPTLLDQRDKLEAKLHKVNLELNYYTELDEIRQRIKENKVFYRKRKRKYGL